ncbi:MAG TPA: thiamine phosphate synthase [Candidatus Angelobacter sp.]|nr:thiamine phosphate synthase [Candidatus Angelobacter sp.]
MRDGLESNHVLVLPPLYAIIDFSNFAAQADPVSAIVQFAEKLMDAGAKLIQLRDKSKPTVPQRFLSCARELRRVTLDRATLIMNDRIDLCLAVDADGVHLGQEDLSPAAAKRIFDQVIFDQNKDGQRRIIGFSTHNLDQLREANSLPVDYIAIGPVFATSSKANPDPVIGLEGVRAASRATTKPLVAIGGITRQNCRQVREAGAGTVAVISDLFESPGKAVADFLRILG